MSGPTTIKWTTPGKILLTDGTGKPVDGPPPIEKGNVEITEKGNSFYMRNDAGDLLTSQPIAGIPVDANLAVYLIKRLYDKIRATVKIAGVGDQPALTETETWLIDLLLNSRAITIDKNSLLKTISQPGCEGIRFYLCTKPEKNAAQEDIDVLSLVTVGVDNEGKDLGYEFDSGVAAAIEENDIFGVSTKSLAVEFNYPPPWGGGSFNQPAAAEVFVIGSYAW